MSNISAKVDRRKLSKLKNFRSIRYTIPLIIITPLITAISAIGWLTFQRGQQQIDQLISEIRDKSTAAIQSKVEGYLASHNAFLTMQQGAIERRKLESFSFNELQNYFWWQLLKQENQENSIWKVYLGNERGDYLGVERDSKQYFVKIRDRSTQGKRDFYLIGSKGNRSQKKLNSEDYNSTNRYWYQNAKKVGKVTWSDIYGITNGDGTAYNLGITLAAPIFDLRTGNIEAILATDLTLSNISRFLQELSISATSKALLIDRKGCLVASSTYENLLKSDGKDAIKIMESTDPAIRAIGKEILDRFGDFHQIKGEQKIIATINSQPQFVEIKPLQSKNMPDWLIILIIPKADFMGPAYDYIKFSIIVGLLVIGAAIVIALITVKRITQPIEQLHQAAQGIQSENFDGENLQKMTKRHDEFGELAKVFLGMMQVIYSREQNWKQLVEQLETENSDVQNQRNSIDKKHQAIYLEKLLKRARSLRTEGSQSSQINSKD